ncbi:MAG: hypothetical protein M1820_001574 [Bogoriella megaspora]|nr:MAG: hypothetical protein M1820_001574 [Bogoriella megaspora]
MTAPLQTTPAFEPSASDGYPIVLDHIMSYPGTYEIPLRTMYTLNSAPRVKPMPQQIPISSGSHPAQQDATAQFTSSLLSQISQLPSQPCSLPPSFINNFVRNCFTANLLEVDFPQALTALDYLKDLEHRRRREFTNALERLGMERSTLETELETVSKTYPGVTAWVKSLQEKEKRVEALYTQIYIGLRRWILINELQLQPFNKHNCIAMLNTLYPPVMINTSTPTTHLTPTVLQQQRDGWFKYIQAVEGKGPKVLQNLAEQGKRPGDANGWSALRHTLDSYLRTASSVITECSDINSLNSFTALSPTSSTDAETGKKRGRKADSGVSFTSNNSNETHRPSTSGSSGSSKLTSITTPSPTTAMPAVSRGSTIERLAREIFRIKPKKTSTPSSSRPTSSDHAPAPTAADDSVVIEVKEAANKKPKTLKKIKSLGALSEGHKKGNLTDLSPMPPMPTIDKNEMEKLKAEGVSNKKGGRHSAG